MSISTKNVKLSVMKKGLLIIISGPSGVGKGTIRKKITEKDNLNLWFSVSMTTRNMRPGEEDGREYFFVSKENFLKTLSEGGLLESNQYVGNYYGTPKEKVEEMREKGFNVLLEIDVNGAEQVMKAVGKENVCSIFILPPSIDELEKRIRGRSTENEETIASRLSQASREMAMIKDYRYSVTNDNLDKCANEIANIIKKESERE